VMNLASELQSGLVTISAQVWWFLLENLTSIHVLCCLFQINIPVVTFILSIFRCCMKQVIWGCVLLQVESGLTELPFEERSEFLNSLGVSESCLGNLIRATYSLLGLRTYFTSGEKVNYLKKSFLNTPYVFIIWRSIFIFSAGNKSLDHTFRLVYCLLNFLIWNWHSEANVSQCLFLWLECVFENFWILFSLKLIFFFCVFKTFLRVDVKNKFLKIKKILFWCISKRKIFWKSSLYHNLKHALNLLFYWSLRISLIDCCRREKCVFYSFKSFIWDACISCVME
jgi:hypothetical protein